MTKIPASRLWLATLLLGVPAALWGIDGTTAFAKPRARVRLASLPKTAKRSVAAKKATAPLLNENSLPRYVSMPVIKRLQAQNKKVIKQSQENPLPVLQPVWDGHALKTPMRDLLSGPTLDLPPVLPVSAKTAPKTLNGERLAQVFPRTIAPASPAALRRAATPITPRWVRYPLEFQLAGIGLGSRAVDKDRFNRIDRYGLFALHGNPTAVVRQVDQSFIGGGTSSSGTGGGATAGGGGAGAAGAGTVGSLTLQQTPPETAPLFPYAEAGGGLPDWALAVTVFLDNNHVEWLYKRDTYSMGFVVDRLGFVDAILVAGFNSDITRTQLEDPVHTVKLGDDLRKVLFRYGYPDDIVPLANEPASAASITTGAVALGGGGGGAAAGAGAAASGAGGGGAPAGGGGGGGGGSTTSTSVFTSPVAIQSQNTQVINATFRTYDLRYEQSYNVVFTIRNNRVIRIYIFGDPDFYNAQRRNQIRTKY